MEVEPNWAAKAPMEKGEGSEWQGLYISCGEHELF